MISLLFLVVTAILLDVSMMNSSDELFVDTSTHVCACSLSIEEDQLIVRFSCTDSTKYSSNFRPNILENILSVLQQKASSVRPWMAFLEQQSGMLHT